MCFSAEFGRPSPIWVRPDSGFGLLDAKPCRLIWKLPQKVSFGTGTCEIEPKLFICSCPKLLLTPSIKKHTRENIWKILCFVDSSTQNHAESSINFIKKYFLDPNVRNWTKTLTSVMSGPTFASPGGQVLVSKAGFCFYFFRFMIFHQSREFAYKFKIFEQNLMFYWPNLWSLLLLTP